MFVTMIASFVALFSGFVPVKTSTKFVVIDLKEQRLCAFEDTEKVFELRICSGRAGKRTPIGTFFVHDKRERGKALPKYGGATLHYPQRLVGHILIHGYHSVPRRPSSNGCIRLTVKDAKKLYDWTEDGTRVKIQKDAPDCLL